MEDRAGLVVIPPCLSHLKLSNSYFLVTVAKLKKSQIIDYKFFIKNPKPKRFGCIVAAGLLILSLKELI